MFQEWQKKKIEKVSKTKKSLQRLLVEPTNIGTRTQRHIRRANSAEGCQEKN